MTELLFNYKISTEMDIYVAIHKASVEIKNRSGFDAVKLAKLKTTISELGHNILKYAKTGYIAMHKIEEPKQGIKIVASDQGPGIADIKLAMQDYYSSSGTLGLGLPGIRRMMDEFSISSELGQGTEVSVILYAQ